MTDVTEETIDYTYPLGKPATSLQARFANWLQGEEVGYAPESAESKVEAFNEGVRLAVALRIPFQASDHNRAATAQEREERAADRAKKAQEREEAKKAREAAAAAAPAEETSEEAPKPKAKAKAAATPAPTPAAAPTVKRAPARRTPATTAAPGDSAPF